MKEWINEMSLTALMTGDAKNGVSVVNPLTHFTFITIIIYLNISIYLL